MILRGLWERRTLSLIVLLIAIVPVASAAVGPIYSAAARTTIVRDVVTSASLEGRGWRYTTRTGKIREKVAAFTAGAAFTARPIHGLEATSGRTGDRRAFSLVWQEGQCAHLPAATGRCPGAAGEVMASQASGFRLGETIRLTHIVRPGPARLEPVPLTVVGLYRPASAEDPFWFGRTLFSPSGEPGKDKADALFTVPQTTDGVLAVGDTVHLDPNAGRGWTEYAIVYLDPARLHGTDLDRLAAMQAVAESAGRRTDAIVFSRMGDTLRTMSTSTGSLGVPTLLVIAQLVGLGWLLLFQTVGDLVKARGPEIALARLRGHTRLKVARFALAEPVLLLAVAIPLGLLLGHAAAGAMIAALLPPGVPPLFPLEAALAGVAATLGGLLAAVLASWRAVTRPVTEEWRRTPRRRGRGWVPDAVVLSITALGLVELLATGTIVNVSGQSSSALAVPGLIALGVALLAGRALPVLSGRLFGLTRRRGGLGPFLALRQVARGPVTAGSVIVLAMAFGLATFAVSAWTAAGGDYRQAARFHNGAPLAITVGRMEPTAFRAAVAAADPGGRAAVPVIKVPGPPVQMIAADTSRLAHVAYWSADLAGGKSLAAAAAQLPGPAAPRVWLRGERLRVTLEHERTPKGWTTRLFAVLRVGGEPRPIQLPLGVLNGTGGVLEWNLPPACRQDPCELRALRGETAPVEAVGTEAATPYVLASVKRLSLRENGRWTDVSEVRWRVDEDPDLPNGTFVIAKVGNQTLRTDTYTPALPAIAVGDVGKLVVPGLDNSATAGVTTTTAAAAAPGLSAMGVLVDLEQADRRAYGVHDDAVFQVWTDAADPAALERALRAQGVRVMSRQHVDELADSYAAQGPGLALMLLLASALAAAVLALGRTVLALYAAARRRAYELAALEAAGAGVPALRVALLLEQVITVVAGTLAGLLAGLLAAEAALGRIPRFAEPPVTPPLPNEVTAAPIALVIGVALLVSLLAAVVVSEILLRGIKVERLREAPA
ncbi:hypothetical protein HII36_44820 [Nonomuraea sp. NN258]|uniref:FtsX-like permease family protein n=1 Tax=Nonomuraea antri TaxID=2730852 RepID=UPI0015687F82|nr:FtsX-like permease family protein [Nonomuraea antri]NRQ38898.1 hypothetical protein [Nonomuraea antri]